MTASVVSLESHRRNRPPPCGCPRHLLEALAHRVTAASDATACQLLVDQGAVESLAADVTRTIAAALGVSEVAR